MAGGKTQGTILNKLDHGTGLMDQKEWQGKENPGKPYPQSIQNGNEESFEQLPDPIDNTSAGALVYTAPGTSMDKAPLKIVVAWENAPTEPGKLAYTKIYLASQAIDWDAIKANLDIGTAAAKDNLDGVTSTIEWSFISAVPSINIQFHAGASK